MAQEQTGKIEDMLRELGKKIDVLISEAKGAKDEIRDEVEIKIQELKVKKDELENDIRDYKKDEKWQDAKSHLSNAVTEMKNAMEALISSLKKQG